jgi:hypothetical protein
LKTNAIRNINFNFTTPCLSQLETLDIADNYLTELPVTWMNQMHSLDVVYLSNNQLTCLSYDAFNNISRLTSLWFDRNNLRTIELWMFQMELFINALSNPIERFSNYFNVDLSDLQYIPSFDINNSRYPNINFDDTVFEMYNRCAEVHDIPNFNTTASPRITLIILSILDYPKTFYFQCTCDKYYFYRVAFATQEYLYDDFFFNWTCPGDTLRFAEKCNYQSSANFLNVIPRLCKINGSEPGVVPVYANSSHCGMVRDSSHNLLCHS